jgi:hypothetical protein
LPAPFVCAADHVEGIALRRQIRQQVAELLRPAVPADDQTEAQRAGVDLPLPHEFHPLAFGELGVDHLQWLVAQRAQALTILAKRLEDVRIHPRFGPDNKETARILYTAEIMQIDIAPIG